jgi:uncharacterized RDD family membrane protein YckC
MELTDKRIIATPEGVPIELILAGLGSRFVAIFIDTLIQSVTIYLITVLYFFILASSGFANYPSYFQYLLVILLILSYFMVSLGYFIVFEMLTEGRSPGKLVAKIKVVDIDGGGLTFRASLIRNLCRIIDYLPTYYMIGATVVFFSERNQRIGDFAARTVVIQHDVRSAAKTINWRQLSWINSGGDNTAFQMTRLFTDYGRFVIPPELKDLDITQLNYNDINVIQNFLVRRYQLPPTIREKMAYKLAASVTSKIGGYNNNWPPEVLLETIVALKNLK